MVSVTFRQLTAEETVRLTVRANLAAIEWGGDVHVPHGDLTSARNVAARTRAAGLRVAGYASYYVAGHSEKRGLEFGSVLATAVELGAPAIRVWAGKSASTQTSPLQRQRTVADLWRIASLAEKAGIRVAMEFHAGTLTDSVVSTVAILRHEACHPNLRTHWQPRQGEDVSAAVEGLLALRPWLENIHVFHWSPPPVRRLPLAEGEERWLQFLQTAAGAHHALLEFVPDDDPSNLVRDAVTLNRWLKPLTVARIPTS